MFPNETEYFKVSLDDTEQIAVLHWKKTVNLPEYQEGLRVFIRLVGLRAITKSLIDSTQRGDLNIDADEWVFNSIKSEIAHLDITNHLLALVISEERYQRQIQSYSLLQAGKLDLPISINYFTSLSEAHHWLLHENLATS